jgi:TPR repeat protein
MKAALLGAALILGAACAAGLAASQTPAGTPDAAQVQAWLRGAADARDAGAEAALARWSAQGDAGARRAYAALLAHRNDPLSREQLEQVLGDGARSGDALAATLLAELLSRSPSPVQAQARAARDARIARLLAQGATARVPAATRALAMRTRDPARATALLAQAADDGDAPAMFLLANQLRAGQGVARDDARALALYQRAADADYAPAIQALTLAWRYGELGLQADASQSRLMDHEAAEALAHATR